MDFPRIAYPIDEFCQAVGLGRSTVYKEIASGRLRTVKVGRRRLVLIDEGKIWLRSLQDTAADESIADDGSGPNN